MEPGTTDRPPGKAPRESCLGVLRVLLATVALVSVQHYREDVHPANEASRVYGALALVDHQTPVLDPVFDRYFPNWRAGGRPPNVDVAVFQGRYHLDKAPGVTLLAVPWVWLMRLLGLDLPFRWMVWGLTLLLCALPSALFAEVTGRRLQGHGLPVWPLWAAVLASPWLAYGGMLFGHALAAALVGLALVLGLGPLGEGLRRSRRREVLEALLGGLAAGLAVLVEYPAAFFVGLLVLSLGLAPGRRHRLPWVLLGGLPVAALLLAWNAWNFGDPLVLSYAFKSNADLQAIHGQGAYGFTWPTPERLVGICLGSRRGLFFAAPWLLAGVVGALAGLWDRRLPHSWRMALAVGGLGWPLFIAGFVDWTAGMTFGPRHLLAGLPVLAIGTAVFWRQGLPALVRVPVTAWVGTSLLLNAAAAWTFPYAHPEVRNPIGEVLVPVLVQAGPAPTVWDPWLPSPMGALVALGAALWVLWLSRDTTDKVAPSRPSRPVLATLGLAWACLHLALALGLRGAPEEERLVLRNRALAFEMMGRKDLAAAALRSLKTPGQGGPQVPAPPP